MIVIRYQSTPITSRKWSNANTRVKLKNGNFQTSEMQTFEIKLKFLERLLILIAWCQSYVSTFYKYKKNRFYTIGYCSEQRHFQFLEVIIAESRDRYPLSEPWSFLLKTFASLYFGKVCLRSVYPLYTMQKWWVLNM